jgi:hypothetical protein
MNISRLLVAFTLCSLTLVRPSEAPIKEDAEQTNQIPYFTSWQHWLGIGYKWTTGKEFAILIHILFIDAWNTITSKVEKAIIIRRLNIDEKHLVHEDNTPPAAIRQIERGRNGDLNDQWVMISAPLIAVIVVSIFMCSVCVCILRCMMRCCCGA